jgi:hypothetical protein
MINNNDIEIDYDELEWKDISKKEKIEILKRRLNTLDMVRDNFEDELDELEESKKIYTEIPENPFDTDEDDDEIYASDEEDDIEERVVTSGDVEGELDRLGWKDEDDDLYEYLEQNSKNIEKGFYCYVVSQIGRDNLQGYMDGFRDMLKQSITKKEEDKLPDVIKKDDVTMDFRKKEIERTADRLSNSVVSDLFSMLDMKN